MTTRPERIDAEVAAELFEEGGAVFVDARPPRAFARAEVRIPGSVRIEPGQGAATDAAILALPRELTLIAYCDEPGQAASAQIARRARELGHGDGLLLDGGLDAWRAGGFPVEPIAAEGTDPGVFDAFSDEDLVKLCAIIHRLDYLPARGRPQDWGVPLFGHVGHDDLLGARGRDGATAYLTGVPRWVVERFREFLRVEQIINVPDDHDARVANLPAAALDKGAVHPDEALVLIRWLTWNADVPLREVWWDPQPGYR